jgi:hypothetical protein
MVFSDDAAAIRMPLNEVVTMENNNRDRESAHSAANKVVNHSAQKPRRECTILCVVLELLWRLLIYEFRFMPLLNALGCCQL